MQKTEVETYHLNTAGLSYSPLSNWHYKGHKGKVFIKSRSVGLGYIIGLLHLFIFRRLLPHRLLCSA